MTPCRRSIVVALTGVALTPVLAKGYRMPERIRPATPSDSAAIVPLLLRDADHRRRLNPALWAVPADARARVLAALRTIGDPVVGPVRHHWLVAEGDAGITGVAHAANLPAPPIYDLRGGTAGIVLDDTVLPADRSRASALIAAAERATEEAGAVLFVAACPADWDERRACFERAGYAATTLYMAKTGLGAHRQEPAVRIATDADLPTVVRLGNAFRAKLKQANPVFWNPRIDADLRFEAWMKTTLTLADRRLFVSDSAGTIDGFLVAQPGSPIHLPAAHDAARIGLIDDFVAAAYTDHAGALIDAAEADFHARGRTTALAICPAKMFDKAALLERFGYRTANLWMTKAGRAR